MRRARLRRCSAAAGVPGLVLLLWLALLLVVGSKRADNAAARAGGALLPKAMGLKPRSETIHHMSDDIDAASRDVSASYLLRGTGQHSTTNAPLVDILDARWSRALFGNTSSTPHATFGLEEPAIKNSSTHPAGSQRCVGSRRPSLTIITSAKEVGPIQLAAIYSWVHNAQAEQVIVFTNGILANMSAFTDLGLTPAVVKFHPLPLPVSAFSGKPKVSRLIETGTTLGNTEWFALFNSDIIVSSRFSMITSLVPASTVVTGLRIDCKVSSEGLLARAKNVSAVDDCKKHSTGAQDFFMWKSNVLEQMLASRGGVKALDMFFGDQKWDNAFIHLTRRNLIDVTPFHLALHVSSYADVGRSGYRDLDQKEMEKYRNATVFPDGVHNARTVCRLASQDQNYYKCSIKSAIYEAKFQLCPSGVVNKLNRSHREKYRVAYWNLNREFPDDIKPLKELKFSSNPDAQARAAELEQKLLMKYPMHNRLSRRIERGEVAYEFGCPNGTLEFISDC